MRFGPRGRSRRFRKYCTAIFWRRTVKHQPGSVFSWKSCEDEDNGDLPYAYPCLHHVFRHVSTDCASVSTKERPSRTIQVPSAHVSRHVRCLRDRQYLCSWECLHKRCGRLNGCVFPSVLSVVPRASYSPEAGTVQLDKDISITQHRYLNVVSDLELSSWLWFFQPRSGLRLWNRGSHVYQSKQQRIGLKDYI